MIQYEYRKLHCLVRVIVKEEISLNYAEGSNDHSFGTGVLITVYLETEVMKEHVNNTTHNPS